MEEEFDELEYTGPDEDEVYERFDKIQKTFKTYVNAKKSMVILIIKQSKLDRNSQNAFQN